MSMRIEVDEPELADDLATYLVEAGYHAQAVEGGAVDARLPFAIEEVAARDLRLILQAWGALTGGVATYVLRA